MSRRPSARLESAAGRATVAAGGGVAIRLAGCARRAWRRRRIATKTTTAAPRSNGGSKRQRGPSRPKPPNNELAISQPSATPISGPIHAVTVRSLLAPGPLPESLLDEQLDADGAGSGHVRAGLVLPGHLVPATLLDEFGPRPAARFLEFLELLGVVRLLGELGDADRRLAGHDGLARHVVGRAGGRPTAPPKADDHGHDGPTNHA